MIRKPRGGPGQFDARLTRAEELLAAGGSARAPLAALVAVLEHQRRRAAGSELAVGVGCLIAGADDRRAASRFPLLDLEASRPTIDAELTQALVSVDDQRLPAALRDAGAELRVWSAGERAEQLSAWLDDPALVAPRAGFWFRVAAGPLLELAAVAVGAPPADKWRGPSCPLCGAPAQASVIAEESGEFMGGSPRSLVCARCATWWSFPRAICPLCGEADPRSISGFLATDNRSVRIDGCATCHGYVKTFDLRQPGARDLVPLVDDVATLSLDLWAQARGFDRAIPSFAGA